MVHIAASIEVTDELGGVYQPTYLKRAKNLVRQGRARFESGWRICLLRPPEKCLEDDIMMTTETKITTQMDILTRIDAIVQDHSYLKEAYDAIEKIQASGEENVSVAARVSAVESIAREREETNRKILGLLEKMLGNMEKRASAPAI